MIREQIDSDLVASIKNHDQLKANLLRMLKSALVNAEIEKKSPLDEKDVIAVLRRESKKRADASTQFKDGGRHDLAAKEAAEAALIEQYLPKGLSDQQINEIVDQVIKTTGASTAADISRVIGQTISQIGPEADGAKIAAIVRSKLAN